MRHASFFSGVGGLDLGFERAGIHTVSVSEIDPYACAVLAERFPDAPNLGDIVKLAERELGGSNEQGHLADKNDWRLQRPIPSSRAGWTANAGSESDVRQADGGRSDWRTADIWSGGFPCQDLSVAGKRAGFAGKRSSLAFTFLDLVEQRRPRWLVLENVPGLFSSNNGADFGRLLYEMEQLGYGVSWRTLDARYFGVAQRRRRVFVVASLESDRAGEVLFECEGCERHPAPRWTQREGTASIAGGGTDQGRLREGNRRTIQAGSDYRKGSQVRDQETNSNRMRETDGLARRLDNKQGVDTFGAETHRTLQARDWKAGVSNQDLNILGGEEAFLIGQPILSFPSRFGSNANVTENQAQSMAHSAGAPAVLVKSAAAFKAGNSAAARSIGYEEEISPSLEAGGGGNNKPTVLIEGAGSTQDEDALLPVGLDSHRYRCCGNGVVAPVAEWIGRRIVEVDRRWREEGK